MRRNLVDHLKNKKEDFFFFKQKTAYEIKECDWSSDVCSSDLEMSSALSTLEESISDLQKR